MMSTNHEHNGEDDALAALRTANALGQTAGVEHAAVEHEISAMPEVRQEVEVIASLAARLKEAAQSAPPVEPSAALRAAVEKRLSELDSPRPLALAPRKPRPWWRRHMAKLAFAAACLVVVAAHFMPPTKIISVGDPREVAMLSASPTEKPPALTKAETQQKLAELVNEFNRLSHEQRYEEAGVIAAKAKELAPDELVSKVMVVEGGLRANAAREVQLKERKEHSSFDALADVDESAIPYRARREAARDAAIAKLDQGFEKGRLTYGVGVDSNTGLVGNVTLDEQKDRQGSLGVPGYGDNLAHNGIVTEGANFYSSYGALGLGGSNSGGQSVPFNTLAQTLGSWGVDTANNDVWAVIDHDAVTLNAANTYAGGTVISGGTLPLAGAISTLGNGAAIESSSAFRRSVAPAQVASNNIININTVNDASILAGTLGTSGTTTSEALLQSPTRRHVTLAPAYAAGSKAPGFNSNDTLDPTRGEKSSGNARGLDNGKAERLRIESLPGVDALVSRGDPRDAARAEGIIRQGDVPASSGKQQQAGGDQNSTKVAMNSHLPSSYRTGEALEQDGSGQGQRSSGANFNGQPSTTTPAERKRLVISAVIPEFNKKNTVTKPADLEPSDKDIARIDTQKGELGKSGSGMLTLVPKKPAETWKPARVVPNASRLMVGEREELPLKGMQVDVRVDGFRARVLLDLYYFNDRQQQLEGNFQLRLPDEAAPYFFAFGRTVYQAPQIAPADSMFFKPQQVSLGDTTPEKIMALRGNSWEQPKVARMVPKEKAALAYRDTMRRRIDPALVEWSGAGVFQCRVFPLAPQSLHRVTIGYDVDLVRVGDDLELRLDLPEHAPATVVDLNVAAADARQVSLDAPATQSPDGRRLAYHLVDPRERPIVVRLRKPGTLMLTGNDEATGDYFATRVTLPLPEEQGAKSNEQRAKQAIFLVDTSLSAGPQFPLWTKMLRATLDNNRDQIKQFAVLFFNVETFWWQEKYVANTPENVDAVINYADNLALEGATDLGRALKEAANPKWAKSAGSPPDLFLLSDGAATWGEDRWGLLAAEITKPTLTPGPSPSGRGEQVALTPGPSPGGRGEPCSALFAYRTGLAGGDSRLLGYLAQRTGGAVFSLVGEAEIAAASVAHRNRPWRLTAVEMGGAHDLLVAGRPQYVFPGQQLTIVGRLEARLREGEKGRGGEGERTIIFTLQQGSATQTVKVPMEQVISSELAARTFGQVATNQLEEVCGVALTPSPSPGGRGESIEPVATAYARHFRITGRTCSLLMLETEQDYARFNIKPEEDSFVVKERPADAIVGKAIAEAIAAMSDPKASFLAWYSRLGDVGSAFQPAGGAEGLYRRPAGGKLRAASTALGVQAAAAERSAGKPAAAVAHRAG